MISTVRTSRALRASVVSLVLAMGLGLEARAEARVLPVAADGLPVPHHEYPIAMATGRSRGLWEELAALMRLGDALPASHERERRWLRANRRHVTEVLTRGQTYLPHIIGAVRRRGLPAELALLPAIESGFRPDVRSPDGADGLWQFMPATGESYGLRRSWWYDGRRDVVAATEAALDYLEELHGRFDGNWLLAIAAYNCGTGAMDRARRRVGSRSRSSTASAWQVLAELPGETRRYLPRLLALSELIRDPERYRVRLPELSSTPQFAVVDTHGQIEIALAAGAIGVRPQRLRELNPGFRRWVTDPLGPHRLLVPTSRANALRRALTEAQLTARSAWGRHTVRWGESLSSIAALYRTEVHRLMEANRLATSAIRAGSDLLVPRPGPAPEGVATYRVRSGDSLWRIARRHQTTVEALLRLNGLTRSSVLLPGQTIRIA